MSITPLCTCKDATLEVSGFVIMKSGHSLCLPSNSPRNIGSLLSLNRLKRRSGWEETRDYQTKFPCNTPEKLVGSAVFPRSTHCATRCGTALLDDSSASRNQMRYFSDHKASPSFLLRVEIKGELCFLSEIWSAVWTALHLYAPRVWLLPKISLIVAYTWCDLMVTQSGLNFLCEDWKGIDIFIFILDLERHLDNFLPFRSHSLPLL